MSGEELVDLVDESDKVVGVARLADCLSRGLLHRAVAVVVRRSSGRIVLQQRSRSDLWRPGLWTLSSTGHVRSGESYSSAAARELSEELGLVAGLVPLGTFLLPPMTEGGLTEREFVGLFSAQSDSPVTFDRVELEGIAEMTRGDVAAMMRDGPLTPDARMMLEKYFSSVSRPPTL